MKLECGKLYDIISINGEITDTVRILEFDTLDGSIVFCYSLINKTYVDYKRLYTRFEEHRE